jgi:uncharacterized membrane protein (DUF2068 family)
VEHPLRRPELLVCAWRGHVVPGATVHPLDGRHAVLARETVDGRRLVQCLRCGDWIVAEPPAAGAGVPLDRVEDVARPRRGRALREAIVVRVIAVDRAVHTIAFTAVAAAALALRWNLDAIHGWASGMLDALQSARHGNGGASTHGIIAALLSRLGHVQPHSLTVLALFATIYAVVSGFEAVGLWRERRWAEYLTVLATAGFLPLEIDELVKRITFVRVGAMVVNLAILVYLVLSKHLFGARGPRDVYRPEPLQALPDLLPAPRPLPTD